MITGSGFERAEKCPPSTFLPHVKSDPSVHAKAGAAVHRYLCLVSEVGAEAALELVDKEFRHICEAIDLSTLPHASPEGWAFEVAFAWDPARDTARELYRGSGERDYGDVEEHEVPGTADVIGLSDEDTVVVLDLKNGWRRLGAPGESLQLGFYAVAAARTTGATRAIVGWVRLADGTPKYEWAELDAIDLDAMAERLKAVLERAAAAEKAYGSVKSDALSYKSEREAFARHEGELHEGEHCTYCPAFLQCPAKVTLLREMLALPEQPKVIPKEQVGAMLERLWLGKEVIDRTEKMLEEYVRAHPTKLPSTGETYALVEQEKEKIDPVVGRTIVSALVGSELAEKCVENEPTFTKAQLKRIVQPWTRERGLEWAPTERQLLADIKAAGGVTTSRFPLFRRIKQK